LAFWETRSSRSASAAARSACAAAIPACRSARFRSIAAKLLWVYVGSAGCRRGLLAAALRARAVGDRIGDGDDRLEALSCTAWAPSRWAIGGPLVLLPQGSVLTPIRARLCALPAAGAGVDSGGRGPSAVGLEASTGGGGTKGAEVPGVPGEGWEGGSFR